MASVSTKAATTGQEIVARAQYLGEDQASPLSSYPLNQYRCRPACRSLPRKASEHPCGLIANAAPAPDGGYDALAVIQESFVESGDLRLDAPKYPDCRNRAGEAPSRKSVETFDVPDSFSPGRLILTTPWSLRQIGMSSLPDLPCPPASGQRPLMFSPDAICKPAEPGWVSAVSNVLRPLTNFREGRQASSRCAFAWSSGSRFPCRQQHSGKLSGGTGQPRRRVQRIQPFRQRWSPARLLLESRAWPKLAGTGNLRAIQPSARYAVARNYRPPEKHLPQALTLLPATEPFFDLLADKEIVADRHLPETGVPLEWERVLSAVFVSSADYGTRASTLLTMRGSGLVTLIERNFGRAALPLGEVYESFQSSEMSTGGVNRHAIKEFEDVGIAHADTAVRTGNPPFLPCPDCRGYRCNGACYRRGRAD